MRTVDFQYSYIYLGYSYMASEKRMFTLQEVVNNEYVVVSNTHFTQHGVIGLHTSTKGDEGSVTFLQSL